MTTIYHNIGHLYTPAGTTAVRGEAMRDIRHIENAVIIVRDGMIAYAGERIDAEADVHIDCHTMTALPGFVDSHTHAVFMGERSNEFCLRAEGRSYQEIAESGGGIRSTVAKVRAASPDEIAYQSAKILHSAFRLGTTTMEIKSGYGLTALAEENLLLAAEIAAHSTGMQIVRTWLGAHALPDDRSRDEYIEELITEQVPMVIDAHLAEFADVFCDEGYYTNRETELICTAATRAGLKIKLHADELADTGGAELAVSLGAYSADHLLKTNDDGIRALAESQRTVAALLPITALCIRQPFARARAMVNAGCAVAIATDCNPGSSMSENMQLALSLAVIGMSLSPEEALTAATLNGAAAIDRADTIGSIEAGKQADFVLYDIPSLAYLPYHIGVSDVKMIVKRGEVIHSIL